MDDDLLSTIRAALSGLPIHGKTGHDLLQPTIAEALNEAGFDAVQEDKRQLLPPLFPVWRSKDTGKIEETRRRRRIDIVVYKADSVIALVETESDLNDLHESGVSRRNGHYDVSSIAQSQSGKFFDSYKSLERMAATAFFASLDSGVNVNEAVPKLERVHSDAPRDHNPLGLQLVLVSGSCRERDRPILTPRLKSLGAELICARGWR